MSLRAPRDAGIDPIPIDAAPFRVGFRIVDFPLVNSREALLWMVSGRRDSARIGVTKVPWQRDK
jgi:hypothetical protein